MRWKFESIRIQLQNIDATLTSPSRAFKSTRPFLGLSALTAAITVKALVEWVGIAEPLHLGAAAQTLAKRNHQVTRKLRESAESPGPRCHSHPVPVFHVYYCILCICSISCQILSNVCESQKTLKVKQGRRRSQERTSPSWRQLKVEQAWVLAKKLLAAGSAAT